ncbi:hypothetical protein C8F01DRAFT_995622 [Mycena amicta]|nr:hypothetical protein C8F01DRAFT_995622 [Mycena amicta]
MLSLLSRRFPLLSAHPKLFSTVADDGAVVKLRPANEASLKRPVRGGQNLSMRYRRLEQSLRGKAAQQRDKSILSPDPLPMEVGRAGRMPVYFRGLEVPQEPNAPASDECCMSGCAVCVYDLYEESLAAYRDAVATFRGTLLASGVPHSEWPAGTHPDGGAGEQSPATTVTGRSVIRDAFEELERALAQKNKEPAL